MGKERKLEIPQDVHAVLDNGDKKTVFMPSWHEHVMNRREIASFITIVGDKMYNVRPKKDEIMMPYIELNGDHNMNWILILNKVTNEEISRKNTRSVDMVEWKLSSSLTNSEKDGKK